MQPLRNTVFHPQWLATSKAASARMLSRIDGKSRVLDIGCADGWTRSYLPESVQYVGLDYPLTAMSWYHSRPDVFADAARIPFSDASFDAVILFDVLEHLPEPEKALPEILRVLKPGGHLLMNTPFMYPLHDEPLDFHRWTQHGHRLLATSSGFDVESITPVGRPLRAAFLALNIALCKMCINGFRRRRPAALLLPVLPAWIVANNLLAWLLGWLEIDDGLMPVSYQCVLRRPVSVLPERQSGRKAAAVDEAVLQTF